MNEHDDENEPQRSSRWIAILLGMLLIAVSFGFALAHPEPLVNTLLQLGMAIALGVGLIAVGYRYLISSQLSNEYTGLVVKWAFLGLLVMLLMNVWFQGIQLILDHIDWQISMLTMITAGVFGGTLLGITNAKSRHQQAQREQALSDYREIFEKAEIGILIIHPEKGTVAEVNKHYADMTGFSEEELEGKTIDEVSGDDPDYDQEAAMARIQEVLQGKSQRFDWLVKCADGSNLLVEVALKRSSIGGKQRLIGFAIDISDRREFEEQLKKHRDELEFFNSLLRHDVLNGITVIRTRGSVLAEELSGEHQVHAETVVEWSDNVTSLVQRVRDVLDTLTGDVPEMERVNLSEHLREQMTVIENAYPMVEFSTDIQDDIYVNANDLLAEVFKNILTNAVDHNDIEGLRIETRVEVEDGTIAVRFADNGTGISEKLRETVFERGRTGHVKSSGSGFGLFFVKAMVTAYNGDIRIEDNDMGGATFSIELPHGTD